MKAAAGFVGGIVKLPPRMEGGKDQTFRADAFLMHTHGNAAAIVLYGGRAVRLKGNGNGITVSCQMFVHRIIHDFIYQMIQTLGGDAADVHPRSSSYRF